MYVDGSIDTVDPLDCLVLALPQAYRAELLQIVASKSFSARNFHERSS